LRSWAPALADKPISELGGNSTFRAVERRGTTGAGSKSTLLPKSLENTKGDDDTSLEDCGRQTSWGKEESEKKGGRNAVSDRSCQREAVFRSKHIGSRDNIVCYNKPRIPVYSKTTSVSTTPSGNFLEERSRTSLNAFAEGYHRDS
jgi:hypothetical protein